MTWPPWETSCRSGGTLVRSGRGGSLGGCASAGRALRGAEEPGGRRGGRRRTGGAEMCPWEWRAHWKRKWAVNGGSHEHCREVWGLTVAFLANVQDFCSEGSCSECSLVETKSFCNSAFSVKMQSKSDEEAEMGILMKQRGRARGVNKKELTWIASSLNLTQVGISVGSSVPSMQRSVEARNSSSGRIYLSMTS